MRALRGRELPGREGRKGLEGKVGIVLLGGEEGGRKGGGCLFWGLGEVAGMGYWEREIRFQGEIGMRTAIGKNIESCWIDAWRSLCHGLNAQVDVVMKRCCNTSISGSFPESGPSRGQLTSYLLYAIFW